MEPVTLCTLKQTVHGAGVDLELQLPLWLVILSLLLLAILIAGWWFGPDR